MLAMENLMDDEKQLDDFLIKSQEQPNTPAEPGDKTEEDIVEDKAREGKPLASSILQNRTKLSETQINAKITATIRKHSELDEQELRQRIATHLENADEITEADYTGIVNNLLAQTEQDMPGQQGPVLSPPPFVASGIQTAQAKTQQIADWAGSLATPGGVGMLVFVLLFFIWVIVPVSNGKTRMQLLWGVLTNQVGFDPSLEAQGAGADFGNVTPTPTPTVTGAIGGGRVDTSGISSFDWDEY